MKFSPYRLPYYLYCVGGDVKHCTINQSPYGSPIPLVFADWVSCRNSNSFPPSRCVKQGRCWENKLIFNFKRGWPWM